MSRAQGVVEIDPATVAWKGTELTFQFQAPEGDPADWQVEESADVGGGGGAAATWKVAATAIVEGVGPGIFRGRYRVSDAARAFLRLRRTGLPPMGPAPLLNEVMADNFSAHAAPGGGFVDWIELYNPHDEAVKLGGYGLTDDPSRPGRWLFPEVTMAPGGFLVVYANDTGASFSEGVLHADFAVRSSGETLVLSDPFGREVDRVELPLMGVDQSVGRAPGGGDVWNLYSKAQATPGKENAAVAQAIIVAAPKLEPDGGWHDAAISVRSTAGAGTVVRHTTDGSPVTLTSPVLAAPLSVGTTTLIRAAAFDAAGRRSDEVSRLFGIGPRHSLPVVSLGLAPPNLEFRNGYLFGMSSAVLGTQGQVLQNYPYSGSNAWKDREAEVQLEMFEPDGEVGLRQRAGVKVYGGWGSRGYPQKSLALFARKKFGAGRFEHRIFPDRDFDLFESLVLRVSGNDNQSTHQTPPRAPINLYGATKTYGSYFVNGTFTLLRDGMMQRLLEGTGLDTQAHRPAVVYVNGEYWGIYNLREKLAEAYLVSHHELPEGAFDLIEGYGDARAGTAAVYTEMRNFVNSRSPADEATYRVIAEKYLEIDNFIDYNLAVIFFQNFDIGNVKSWRPRIANGRFRWMVYDQDYGFGLWPAEVYEPAMARDYADYRNMFRFATAGTGTSTGWPNAGGRTLLLRRMLLNAGFKERFLRRCADLLNENFREERVEATIQEMAARIRPEIGAHLKRWSWDELVKRGYGAPYQKEYHPFVAATWETNLQVLVRFARERPQRLRADAAEHFQLRGGTGELEVRVEPPDAGRVRVNSLQPSVYPWKGTYFADVPTTLRPVAKPGFVFAGWNTPSGPRSEAKLDWNVAGPAASVVTARFAPSTAGSVPEARLWITEINYHAPDDLDADDWVEIHNPGTTTVELAGWVLRDEREDRECVLRDGVLGPGQYRVLCRSAAKFRWVHRSAPEPVGEFGFGLGNGGDALRLYDPRGVLSEAVAYDDDPPWPADADGRGATLRLVRPELDHIRPEAWAASATRGGTPGGP